VRFRLELWVIGKISTKESFQYRNAFGEALEELHKKEQEDILIKKLQITLNNKKPRLTKEEKYKTARKKSSLKVYPEEKVRWENDRIFRAYGSKRRNRYSSALYKVREDFEEVKNEPEKEEEKGGGVSSGPDPEDSGGNPPRTSIEQSS
jgi:hypothetical protein